APRILKLLHLHSICSLTIKVAPSCLNLLTDFRSCSIYSKIAPRILNLLHLHSICSLTIKVAPSCLNLLAYFRSCSIYSKIAPCILNLLHLCSLYLSYARSQQFMRDEPELYALTTIYTR